MSFRNIVLVIQTKECFAHMFEVSQSGIWGFKKC